MTVEDLIKRLKTLDKNRDIMILDGFNGGGYPREINLGPTTHIITKEDEKECGDCEGKIGKKIYIMGYGVY